MFKSIKNKIIQMFGGFTEEDLQELGIIIEDEETNPEAFNHDEYEEIFVDFIQEFRENHLGKDPAEVIESEGPLSPLHPDSKPLRVDYSKSSSALEIRFLDIKEALKLADEQEQRAIASGFKNREELIEHIGILKIFHHSESAKDALELYKKAHPGEYNYILYKNLLMDLVNNIKSLDRKMVMQLINLSMINIEHSPMEAATKEFIMLNYQVLLSSIEEYNEEVSQAG